MARFRYEAFDRMGKVTGGVLEANAEEDAAGALRAQGLYVQKIEAIAAAPMRTVLPKDSPKVEDLAPWRDEKPVPQPMPPGFSMAPGFSAGMPAGFSAMAGASGPTPSGTWHDELATEIEGISNVLRFLDTIRDDRNVNIGTKTREMLAEDNLVRIGELAIAAAVSKAARKAVPPR